LATSMFFGTPTAWWTRAVRGQCRSTRRAGRRAQVEYSTYSVDY